jgi:hypothetical protein
VSPPSIPFLPDPGGVLVTLDPDDVELLSQIPEFLRTVGTVEGDPASERLQVPVYLDDPEASDEWWRLMGSDLDSSRTADRSAFELIVEAAAEGTVASIAEAEAILRVLNEARLALAARLNVNIEDDYDRLDSADRGALDYLAGMQALLIEVLSTG